MLNHGTLEKRGKYWYYRYYWQGERKAQALKQTDRRDAEKAANALYDALLNGRTEALAGTGVIGSQTLEQQLVIYSSVATEIRPRTLLNNSNAYKQVIRECSVARDYWINTSTDGLSEIEANTVRGHKERALRLPVLSLVSDAASWVAEHIHLWQQWRLRDAKAKKDVALEARARRTANSLWFQARSIYADALVRKGAYAVVPGAVKAANLKAPPHYYELPDAQLVLKTWEHFEKVRDQKRIGCGVSPQDVYAAFLLASQAGLRAGEIKASRTSWLRDGVINIRVECDFLTKNTSGRRIPVATWVTDWLRNYAGHRQHILRHGNREKVIREVNRQIRKLGWQDTSKALHELRKYYISQVAAQQGIFEAQRHGGHKDLKTTVQNYANITLRAIDATRCLDNQEQDGLFLEQLRSRTHRIELATGEFVTVTDAELAHLTEIAARRCVDVPKLLTAVQPAQLARKNEDVLALPQGIQKAA